MTPESLMQQLDETYFVQKLELLVQQAYEQGVIAGQTRYNYPPVLKREDLSAILNNCNSKENDINNRKILILYTYRVAKKRSTSKLCIFVMYYLKLNT